MKQTLIILLAGIMVSTVFAQRGRTVMEGSGGGGNTADARTAQRMNDLEAQVRRLQAQVDDLAVTLQQGGVQRHAASQSDVQSLRNEVQTLRSENQTLRSENQALRKNVADLIGQLSQRVDRLEAAPRPTGGGGSSGGGSRPSGGSAGQTTMTGVEHTVSAGETLSDIAKAYGVRMDAIVQANNITNPHSLRVGQKLFIPQ